MANLRELAEGLNEKLDELHYLRWFKRNADFGPADSDVHELLDDRYEMETGQLVPARWKAGAE